jgi:TAP-like protein
VPTAIGARTGSRDSARLEERCGSRWRGADGPSDASSHEGYGHLYFQDPSACMNKAILDYLTRLVTPPKGTVCQSDHQPFDPDFGG